MRSLPAGTVTFLFTDIQGSTRLIDELGPGFDAVLAEHGRIIRAAVEGHGGVVVNTEGDSFFAVFESAGAAAEASAQAQRELMATAWPRPVRVRMGLHTGQARLAGQDYIGLDVNRAARIAAAAHGAQVLLSEATKRHLGGALGAGVSLRDLGEHRLKDLPSPERIHQLVIEGLPGDFAPPRSLEMTPTDLPQQLTPFVGRRAQLLDVQRLVASSRMVTLTGPGGTGKTRLCIRVAEEMLGAFPDGVFFVSLAALRDPGLLLSRLASAFGIKEGSDLDSRLVEHIGSKETLLVLDNFEQLLPAASAIGELLARTPRLRIMATSRTRLGLYGEREYPVPPLGVPDPARLPALQELQRSEAVALFIDRARAVQPDFELTPGNALTVTEICVRLDGLPLAIELAAARLRLLAPDAILARLDDRLGLLTTAAPGVPERQRTLRAAIAWSYDLLDEAERRLFDRLGVFLGGIPFGLARRVVSDEDELSLLDRLGSLADQSLLRRVATDPELRLEMLETIREFAVERLGITGEEAQYRERHALVYAEFLEDAAPRFVGDEAGHWLDAIEREHDNIRAAFRWAVHANRSEIALGIASAWRFWQMRGHLVEGRERVEEALAMPGARTDPSLLARALEAAGSLAYWQGDYTAARERYQEALDLQRRHGDPAGLARALYDLSFTYFVPRDDLELGRQLAEEALAIYRSIGDRAGVAETLWALGGVENRAPTPRTEVTRRYVTESRDLFAELGNRRMLAWTHFLLAGTEARDRRYSAARAAAQDALRLFVELGDVSGYALTFQGLASLEWAEGRRAAAARLAAVAEKLQRTSGVRLSEQTSGRWLEADALTSSAIAGDPHLAAAWAQGDALDVESAVAEALALPASPTADPGP